MGHKRTLHEMTMRKEKVIFAALSLTIRTGWNGVHCWLHPVAIVFAKEKSQQAISLIQKNELHRAIWPTFPCCFTFYSN